MNIPYYANKLIYKNGKFSIEFPYFNKDCDKKAGMCKCQKVKESHFCYIGDGTSDLCIASKADFLFGTKNLHKYCKDNNVKATEVKDIVEAILGDNKNLPSVRRVINILICDYLRNYPGGRINSIEFVSYSIKSKPNTKDPILLEMKEIILGWLDENSPNYRRRRIFI